MKLGIGLPITNRLVDKDFFLSFAVMEKPDYTLLVPTYEIYDYAEDIAKTRNGLVVQAINAGCTQLFMMDTDQIYPQHTIISMLSNLRHHDAIGAVVHRRYPPFNPLLMRGELGKYKHVSDEEVYSGKLIDIDATGCGCIVYDMKVFEKIPYPWFELVPNEKGRPVGEDVRFCHKLKKAGFRLGADTSVQVDHLTTFRVDRSTHELYKKLKS